MQSTILTLPKKSCIKMINLASEIEAYYFNGVEHSLAALIQAVTEWPGSEFDYCIEDGTNMVVSSFPVVEIYKGFPSYGPFMFLEFSYEIPGSTMGTSERIDYKKILPIAVELQLIDDYTFDYDVEVICNVEQGGYMSSNGKGWVELPDIRRRMEFNGWLDNLEYEDLTQIAQFYVKKNIAR